MSKPSSLLFSNTTLTPAAGSSSLPSDLVVDDAVAVRSCHYFLGFETLAGSGKRREEKGEMIVGLKVSNRIQLILDLSYQTWELTRPTLQSTWPAKSLLTSTVRPDPSFHWRHWAVATSPEQCWCHRLISEQHCSLRSTMTFWSPFQAYSESDLNSVWTIRFIHES